jgi:hypothetical protein
MRAIALFLCLTTVAAAVLAQQPRRWGAWEYGRDSAGEYIYAATVNDSGHVLGQYCYADSENCIYLLAMTTSCVSGNKYPVLLNADTGSQSVEIYCGDRLGSRYRYIFSNFDSIDEVVKKASLVGFAVPLQEDRFSVVRFDLRGSNEAIAAMLAAPFPARAGRRPTTRGTKDERM